MFHLNFTVLLHKPRVQYICVSRSEAELMKKSCTVELDEKINTQLKLDRKFNFKSSLCSQLFDLSAPSVLKTHLKKKRMVAFLQGFFPINPSARVILASSPFGVSGTMV